MQLTIKTAPGRHIELGVSPTDRIRDVKSRIQYQAGINIGQQVLSYHGMTLQDRNTLHDYAIPDLAVIQLSIKRRRALREKMAVQDPFASEISMNSSLGTTVRC
jgi:hypothetical protein